MNDNILGISEAYEVFAFFSLGTWKLVLLFKKKKKKTHNVNQSNNKKTIK